MFKFWGDGSQEAMDLVKAIRVRSTDNFNWTFIFILAVTTLVCDKVIEGFLRIVHAGA